MQLFLAPTTPEIYRYVVELHQASGKAPPPPPKRSLGIVDHKGRLVVWTGLYEAHPFILAEFFIAVAAQPQRTRHQATELLVEAFLAHAAANGLVALAGPSSSGLAAILRGYGFRPTGVELYTHHMPRVPVTTLKEEPAGKKEAPRSGNGELRGATEVPQQQGKEQLRPVPKPKKPVKRPAAARPKKRSK